MGHRITLAVVGAVADIARGVVASAIGAAIMRAAVR